MSDEYTAVRVDEVERKPSASSGTDHVDLVERLGCTEMRPKVWYLSPGDAMSYHRQTEQEELYYVLRGPGRMKIGGELVDVPEGTAVRVPPETDRQVLNDTDGEHVWLIVGAPPATDDGRPASEDV
ncbi:cupin domain-containing protein [Halomarina pelagica]|uniref:cupin domain-containing protein n=1 Tax=Halomarina pelagica TaxID=2961599 RepID=UPI0020C44550|nr:cupin domain-containing protein [Halomarina sp. BND7]